MNNERDFRQQLSQRISGTHLGLWLLIGFHLKLDSWSILQNWLGHSDPIQCRLLLQLVHESALCVNRIRAKNTLCHQGFAQVNGLSFLATDKIIHHLCDMSISQTIDMQLDLAKKRKSLGHYHPANILALDPHRIPIYTKRITPKRKKQPEEKATKMLQHFFCNDAITGQPIVFLLASGGKSCTPMTLQLIRLIEQLELLPAVFLADKEHYTVEVLKYVLEHEKMEAIVPAIQSKKVKTILESLTYTEHWPAYATARTDFQFNQHPQTFQLIGQRTGLPTQNADLKGFITTSKHYNCYHINYLYPDRWSIEEFFNFEGDMAWNRAATLNLNIRFARQSAALIAQAVCFELRQILPPPYKTWTAKHLAQTIFLGFDGDARVNKDTIIITFYNVPEELGLKKHFENLPQKLQEQGICPKVPWLYDFMVDFRFK